MPGCRLRSGSPARVPSADARCPTARDRQRPRPRPGPRLGPQPPAGRSSPRGSAGDGAQGPRGSEFSGGRAKGTPGGRGALTFVLELQLLQHAGFRGSWGRRQRRLRGRRRTAISMNRGARPRPAGSRPAERWGLAPPRRREEGPGGGRGRRGPGAERARGPHPPEAAAAGGAAAARVPLCEWDAPLPPAPWYGPPGRKRGKGPGSPRAAAPGPGAPPSGRVPRPPCCAAIGRDPRPPAPPPPAARLTFPHPRPHSASSTCAGVGSAERGRGKGLEAAGRPGAAS
ncbi:hypothetical protein P7K49_025947 [Saguinus oedipus]|uniref:Uncharacterized protein n=1 Tax=Saguinus oedipus TaxID=9490 RepID=A0ABQ9UIM5_SAGOE|nr:hypothetical protein P7K49_025947 [Saguinus oedipus]